MISRIRHLVRGKPKRLEDLVVTVYSREQCSCCHKALDLLEKYRHEHGFKIETIDIDTDPDLTKLYGLEIPVVSFNGKVRFKGLVNPVLLERLLAAE